MGLEYKATSATATAAESGVIATDDTTGVVEAIVSVTGVIDEDRDIIEPGGYAATLAKRTPKGIFHHDWHKWVAKTLSIEEIMPGDPRLPATTRGGGAWPREAGALWVKCQFNLATSQGRDAYENVKFFGNECEWSIGYKILPGKATKSRDGTRHIREVDLYEYSPVLFGAAPLSGTLSVKGGPSPDDPAAPEQTDSPQPVDETALHEAASAQDEPPPHDLPDPAPAPANEPATDPGTGEPAAPDPGPGTDQGATPDGGDMSIFDLLDSQPEDPASPESKRKFSAAQRQTAADSGAAMSGGEYPIHTVQDLKNAISAYGRSKPEDRARVRAHIMKRARAIGHPELIPDAWKSGKALDDDGLEYKAGVPGVADTPSDEQAVARLKHAYTHGKLAVQIRWGEPGDFMRCVKIAGKYLTPDKAKGFCANRHKEALGVWPGHEAGHKDDYDPAIEVGPNAGTTPPGEMQGKVLYLPDTLEDLTARLAFAVDELLVAPVLEGEEKTAAPAVWATIDATWPDRIVASRFDGRTTPPVRESFSIPYLIEPGGDIALGEHEPVELTLSSPEGGEPAQLAAKAGLLGHATAELGTALGLETKAGRVLSAANEKQLKAALESLISVLRSAGIDISERGDKPDTTLPDPDPTANNDTTAPSARASGMNAKVLLDPGLVARALRLTVPAASE